MATDGANGPGSKPKKQISPARNIVGVVLFIVFATVAGMEFLANYGYNKAVSAIEKRLPKESSDPNEPFVELPSRAEAEKLIGRAPDGPPVKEGTQEVATYTWRGAIRKHKLIAYYSTGKLPILVRIATE